MNSEEAAYRRLYDQGYRPASIIDVGAYEGNWTRLARSVFPEAASLMVEPQASKVPLLEHLASNLRDTRFQHALLAAESGREVAFFEMETGSSMFPENSNAPRRETRLITSTLDDLSAGLPQPTFLKIDAQGAELEIIKGGRETIRRCDMVQLEVAMLPYNAGAPKFLETVAYMDGLGFVPFDCAGFIRPNGVNLVQVDLLFVPANSPLRAETFTF